MWKRLLSVNAPGRAWNHGAPTLGRLLGIATGRAWSSVAEPVRPTNPPKGASGVAAFVLDPPGPPAPYVLARTPERQWTPLSALSSNEVALIYDALPKNYGKLLTGSEKLALVRDVYSSASGTGPSSRRYLNQILAPINLGSVAVVSEVTRPERRQLVDVYDRDATGTWRLERSGKDLVQYLHSTGMEVKMVPSTEYLGEAESFARVGARPDTKQSTNEVLMVAPTAFESNEETAQDNFFMAGALGGEVGETDAIRTAVLREHAALHHVLTEVAGLKVHLFTHSEAHATPDAVFPNNWFTTHQRGEGSPDQATFALYPLKTPTRRRERREDTIAYMRHLGGMRHPERWRELDFSGLEATGQFFEGTGVLVLDRMREIAYVALSERANEDAAREWVDRMGYKECVTFHSTDSEGRPVYHTNVMLAVGTSCAVVCAESVEDEGERERLLSSLGRHKEVVDITREQMGMFCGNVLEVEDGRGLPCMAMSTQAYNGFTQQQRATLRRHVSELHHAEIPTIERVGGGGVRCTIAEIF